MLKMCLKSKFLLPIVLCFFIKSCLSSDPVEIGYKYGYLPLPYEGGLLLYSCNIQSDFPFIFDPANPIEVSKVDEGNHTIDKTDESVSALEIVNRNIFQIPNLSTIFTGIICIKIHQAMKLRYLVKENIGVYKETLKHLIIKDSGIEIIDRNTFEETTKLQTIDLQNNNLFYINADSIKNLPLSILNLNGNNCFDDNSNPIGNYVIKVQFELAIIVTSVRYSTCKIPPALVLIERYKKTFTELDLDAYEYERDSELNLMLKEEKIAKFVEEIVTAEANIENLTALNNIANQKIEDLKTELETTNLTAETCKSKSDLMEKSIDQMKTVTTQYESTIQELESISDNCLVADKTCRYKNDDAYGYSCIAHNFNITSTEQNVNWTGTHTSAASNDTNVVAMIIKDLDVEYVPRKIGSTYCRLRTLIIHGCGLKKLSRGDFLDLNLVTTVEITSNNISSIDSGVFDDLKSLEHLDLSQNGIKSLPSKIFLELSYLFSLKLDENQLTTLKADFLSTSNSIKYFSATNNKLTKIESSFAWRLKGATFIDFTGNGCNKKFNQTAGEVYINFYSYIITKC